jgi:hypothetical protein
MNNRGLTTELVMAVNARINTKYALTLVIPTSWPNASVDFMPPKIATSNTPYGPVSIKAPMKRVRDSHLKVPR